jgi:LuxR family transcriptional regulator, maltose regulon positive regulatory protein
MTFSLSETIETNSSLGYMEMGSYSPTSKSMSANENFHLIREKLRVPPSDGLIDRARLINLLKKSQTQFPATLISGRAGTGKTALAAAFAAQNQRVCWYSVESTDTEWPLFSRYLSASLLGTHLDESYERRGGGRSMDVTQNEIARFLVKNFSANAFPVGEPALVVLDDIHHIFDAPWFNEFFNLLLYSLPSEAHLLLLCRSRPPAPLWRLRSKQMLNLLDEKVIAFNLAESEALFERMGIDRTQAEDAHRECFGRVSKLREFARTISAHLPSS